MGEDMEATPREEASDFLNSAESWSVPLDILNDPGAAWGESGSMPDPLLGDNEIANTIEAAIAYIESGGDWEENGRTVMLAAPLCDDLDLIPRVVRSLREERDQLQEAIRMLTVDGLTFGAGCSSRDCLCKVPGRVCEEFMGKIHEDGKPDFSSAKCPRCGWDWQAHQIEVAR